MRRQLGRALLRGVVAVHDAETPLVAVLPLEVVDEGPEEVALDRHAVGHRPVQFAQVVAQVVAAVQVARRDSVPVTVRDLGEVVIGPALKRGTAAASRRGANWEPILDRATWEQVRSRLAHAPIGRRPKVNLLAGMCRCGECGAVMAAVSERMDKELAPGQRPPRRTIACDKANRHGCGSNTVKADYVEQIVVDYVLAALEHTDIATARARRAGGDAHQLVASIETDEQFLADLAADYGAQRINRAQFLAAQDPVHARLLLARRRLDQLTIDPSLDGTVFEGVTADSWDRLDLDQQRALVGLFVEHVVIRKGKRGRYFDPSRVQPVTVESAVS